MTKRELILLTETMRLARDRALTAMRQAQKCDDGDLVYFIYPATLACQRAVRELESVIRWKGDDPF